MRAVIVQSNIPHGSFKGQISHYFRQFGVLENVKPGCSKRTGQSYGYAYMVFQHYEVAKIMAVDMNGYLTFAKIVKCKVILPNMVTCSKARISGHTIAPN